MSRRHSLRAAERRRPPTARRRQVIDDRDSSKNRHFGCLDLCLTSVKLCAAESGDRQRFHGGRLFKNGGTQADVDAARRRSRAALSAAALFAGVTSCPATAHPHCDVSAPYAYLKVKYPYVVRARARILTQSRADLMVTGVIELSRLRFVKWPRRETRPRRLRVTYSYELGVDCDWRPNVDARTYFLERTEAGKFSVSSSI
jgi:hypothetical protein